MTIRIPDLMVKESSEKVPKVFDWDEVVRNTDNRRATNIPNTINNPPSGGGFTNIRSSDYMKKNLELIDSLNEIGRYVVREITAFIDDNKDLPINMLTKAVIPDYDGKILAYDKPDFKAFLKLLTFFAISKHDKKTDPKTLAKVSEWLSASKPVFDELKLDAVSKKVLKDAVDAVNKPYTPNKNLTDVMQRARNPLVRLNDQLKILRSPIQKTITGKRGPNIFHAETQDLRTYLGKLMTYYNGENENAYRDIVNGVHLLDDPVFGGVAPEAKHDLEDVKDEAKAFVKKHGGKGFYLDENKSDALKAKNPTAHAEYRKHVGKVNLSIKALIKKACRETNKKLLSARDVNHLVLDNGLPDDFIPLGFNGFYDEEANMYTKKGTRLAIKLNGGEYKDFDPNPHKKAYIAKHLNPKNNKGAGGWVDIYSWEHVNGGQGGREAHKVEVVDKNTANLDTIRDAWRKDMKSKNPEENAHAHFIETLAHTSSRISSKEGNTDGKPTYGLRTLLRKHVKVNQNSITLKFPGKKAMINEIPIKKGTDEHSQAIYNHIAKLVEGKKPNDPVWTYPKGAKDAGKQLSYAKASAYLKSLGWEGGSHKFRHIRGNAIAEAYIKKNARLLKQVKTAKDMKVFLNEMGLAVGDKLGHKKTNPTTGEQESVSGTALKSYIASSIQLKLYRDAKIPAPKALENQALKEDDEDDD